MGSVSELRCHSSRKINSACARVDERPASCCASSDRVVHFRQRLHAHMPGPRHARLRHDNRDLRRRSRAPRDRRDLGLQARAQPAAPARRDRRPSPTARPAGTAAAGARAAPGPAPADRRAFEPAIAWISSTMTRLRPGEHRLRFGIGEHQRQRFRRRHQQVRRPHAGARAWPAACRPCASRRAASTPFRQSAFRDCDGYRPPAP